MTSSAWERTSAQMRGRGRVRQSYHPPRQDNQEGGPACMFTGHLFFNSRPGCWCLQHHAGQWLEEEMRGREREKKRKNKTTECKCKCRDEMIGYQAKQCQVRMGQCAGVLVACAGGVCWWRVLVACAAARIAYSPVLCRSQFLATTDIAAATPERAPRWTISRVRSAGI